MAWPWWRPPATTAWSKSCAALAEEGFEVNKDQVRLEHAIKALGVYEVNLHLPYAVEATIKLWVVKDESEDEAD